MTQLQDTATTSASSIGEMDIVFLLLTVECFEQSNGQPKRWKGGLLNTKNLFTFKRLRECTVTKTKPLSKWPHL